MVRKMSLPIIYSNLALYFPQRNLRLPNRAGPTPPKPRTYERNCLFGPVWGNFQKTCITPGTQLNPSNSGVEKQEG